MCCVCVCVHRHSHNTVLGVLSFLPFSSSLSYSSIRPFVSPFLFHSLFVPSLSLFLSLSPPAVAEGSLVFFCRRNSNLSLARAHTLEADRLQRVLKYRHTRYVLWSVLRTVADLKSSGEARREVTTFLLYWLYSNRAI